MQARFIFGQFPNGNIRWTVLTKHLNRWAIKNANARSRSEDLKKLQYIMIPLASSKVFMISEYGIPKFYQSLPHMQPRNFQMDIGEAN